MPCEFSDFDVGGDILWEIGEMTAIIGSSGGGLFVSVPEAARYLGVSRKTIYNLIEWGEINAVRLNGSIRIERVSLDSFRGRGGMT